MPAAEEWRWGGCRGKSGPQEAGNGVCWDFISFAALVLLSMSLVVLCNFKFVLNSIQCFLNDVLNFLNCSYKITQPKIYHLNYFYMYHSVMRTIFTLLCSRSLELFHVEKLKLSTH